MLERRRVLLVEDSPTQAERLRGFLEADGLHVIHAGSAEAALEQLHSGGADVVVLDYHLPGMNGDEFCRELRMNVNTRAIPVIMLTVEGSDAAQLRGLESGADDYLSKTADPDVVRVRVQALLRRSKGAAPIVDIEKRFSHARVLAIDDSPTFLYLLAAELRQEHYIVETAESPLKGLELVRKTSFDCVLIDYEMPGLDGTEVCRRIREMGRDPDHELVLIMLTSHEDKEHMTRGFEAGADDYIAKSGDMSVTKARIRALLRRKFLLEENQHILNELREKELQAIRAQADKQSAELRALMADQLAEANRELERANRNLDLANQELEQFAYAAAHDLQEPLRMVGIYSQLLQARYSGVLDDAANQYIEFCIDGAKRMDHLIQDLLVYASATHTAEDCTQPVDFNICLNNALANLQGAIKDSKAEILSDTLPALCVEEIRVQQLLQNLVSNAVKYRRPNATPQVRITAERRASEWLFAVRDNGIGIEPSQQARIFRAFKRLHNSEYSGTGLGLAICQRIVQHYDGRIWVESELDGGSSFFFTLPARLESAPGTSLNRLNSAGL
jgi:two-component system NtrC family sensor kinase